MGKGYEPPKFGSSATKGGLRQRILEPSKDEQKRKAQRDRAVEAHIERSPTRKLMAAFFVTAIFSLLIWVVASTAGMARLFGPLHYIPDFFMIPLKAFWHPAEEPMLSIANFKIPIQAVICLAVYSVLYPILIAIHGTVAEDRTYSN